MVLNSVQEMIEEITAWCHDFALQIAALA